jgi:4-phytase / acid phosphatase
MRTLIACVVLFVCASSALPAKTNQGTPIFAVVMTRHGVRSFTKAPSEYTWPDWSPVGPGYLSRHGYVLVTYLGQYYQKYFASLGLPMNCAQQGTYVYADVDQRTLETAHALIEGACGSATGLPLYHDASLAPGVNDPFFDGSDYFVPAGKVDTDASRAAVAAAAPSPPSLIVTQNAAQFAALQSLLDARCNGKCPPANAGPSVIDAKPGGLAALHGPIDVASGYAESLFLEQAQCGPAIDPVKLEEAMKLHVLEYAINARNAYNPLVKGGNIFAHIVGMLQAKAGMPHPDVSLPDISHTNVVILSGHDTELGALGGILGAHWALGNGLVDDDMPPGGALVFVLYREPAGTYSVRVHFVYQTMAQFRSASALQDGIATSPVGEYSLAGLGTRAHELAQLGFVLHDWTNASDWVVNLAPLGDPSWTNCN